jgi:hypothetical protein
MWTCGGDRGLRDSAWGLAGPPVNQHANLPICKAIHSGRTDRSQGFVPAEFGLAWHGLRARPDVPVQPSATWSWSNAMALLRVCAA